MILLFTLPQLQFMANKKTLVLGASDNPSRYSFMAINRLRNSGNEVVGIGLRPGNANGLAFGKEKEAFENIDTVTLYLNPTNQQQYYDYILSLEPKRIIFNPGTENPELEQLAEEKGIETVEGCTLVMLGTGQY